jgi:predicted  nucleic acid-binding Zn-ribbon protein
MNFVSQDRASIIKNLNSVNLELDRLNHDSRNINHQNIDLESQVSRLQAERADILSNLERLTITYDDCVRDITRERRNMTSHND